MKLTILMLAVASQASGKQALQDNVSLSERNAPLITVFKQIKKQTGYSYLVPSALLEQANKVSIDVKNVTLTDALDIIFKDQPLGYSIVGKTIVVKEKEAVKKAVSFDVSSPIDEVKGRVTDPNGEPIVGANVVVKGTNIAAITDKNGEFSLSNVPEGARIEISFVGYEPQVVSVKNRTPINTALAIAAKELDVAIVQGYGVTTRRLNTGNISKVTAEEIARQPITNPLAALQGRVPGMVITQTSGIPGSAFNVQIRGQSSLDLSLSRNDPLFIIDGVPFEQGNLPSNLLVSAANNPRSTGEGGLSPLTLINPSDIESIEILKDADATAIYGSRGANGIVLITTKQGKAGKTKFNVNAYTGVAFVTRTVDMLNTKQYLQMRREAFDNDRVTPTISNAPDLLVFDTTRYTDFKKMLIGGTANDVNLQSSVSGGNEFTQFLLGAGYHRQTNVFSNQLTDNIGSVHLNLNHSTHEKKLKIQFSANYASEKNNLTRNDLTNYINTPPHLLLVDSTGNLNWKEGGIFYSNFNSFGNPLSEFLRKYTAIGENLTTNLQINYNPFKGFNVRTSFGYSNFKFDETTIRPKTSISPNSSTLASSDFANSLSKNWIIEPHAEYVSYLGRGKFTILLGTTWQQRKYSATVVNATDYTNDLLLTSIEAAGNKIINNTSSQYSYTAIFGRLNYNWQDRYILNASGRRDGSSRFGPEKRFANFGALGVAWVFSSEDFIKRSVEFLSFGKLRASYGTTGNDQIGNYKYLDLWNNTSSTYQGVPGFFPNSLFNPDYTWEINKKLEVGLDLGFLNDKILISGIWYRNRSSNQLVNYDLPIQTGFSSVVKNLNALVENSGIEMVLSSSILSSKSFSISSSLNISIPKNKLLSFPGLEGSSYFSKYIVGEPLSIIRRYKFLGVDSQTGVYQFEDVNKDGQITNPHDVQVLGNSDLKYYGGFQNSIRWKDIELDFLFEFKKQVGRNYLALQYNNPPGYGFNQPVLVLDRWQRPGDQSYMQMYTTTSTTAASRASRVTLLGSNGILSDASFIRLKNVSLSYSVPKVWLKNLRTDNIRLYVNAQNLFVITNYVGSDPESQSFYQLPPLRTVVFGLQCNF